MQYTPEDIRDQDGPTYFSADLRAYFPSLENNNEIADLLVKRGVVGKDEIDSESSCFYTYFTTMENAVDFISRLNEVPEIRDYVEPIRPNPNEPYVMISKADWERIRDFMKANISQELRDTLPEIYIFDVEREASFWCIGSESDTAMKPITIGDLQCVKKRWL